MHWFNYSELTIRSKVYADEDSLNVSIKMPKASLQTINKILIFYIDNKSYLYHHC